MPRRSARNHQKKLTDSGWLEKKNWREPTGGSSLKTSKRKNQSSSKPIDKNEGKKSKMDQKPSYSSTKSKEVSREKKLGREEMLLVLKTFDLDFNYGPAIGYTRVERYERAIKFNLTPKPSPKIREILDDNANDQEFVKCCWDQYPNLATR